MSALLPPFRSRLHPRGATLLLVMVVLAAFLLLGAAALRLSQHASLDVSRSVDHTVLRACADAAEKKLWAEYALYNGAVPAVRPTVIPGTDDGLRLSIAHYDADPTAVTAVTFDERSFRRLGRNAMSGNSGEMDQSNTFRTEFGGSPFLVVAHCTDARDRQHEVELLVRFGL
jgi:hypothetical protein